MTLTDAQKLTEGSVVKSKGVWDKQRFEYKFVRMLDSRRALLEDGQGGLRVKTINNLQEWRILKEKLP